MKSDPRRSPNPSRVPATAVRIAGTTAVTGLLSQPLWAPQWGTGLLGEIAGQPAWVSVAIVTGFLGLVALYCRTLQRTLTLIRPGSRRAGPRSVWWMFAVPHNFVEDFFIVRAVAASLAADGLGGREVRRWAILGYGWCGFQVVSLLPGPAGPAGGAAALLSWAAHWLVTARLNDTLVADPNRLPAGPDRLAPAPDRLPPAPDRLVAGPDRLLASPDQLSAGPALPGAPAGGGCDERKRR